MHLSNVVTWSDLLWLIGAGYAGQIAGVCLREWLRSRTRAQRRQRRVEAERLLAQRRLGHGDHR
jgi:hypothetical protein